MMKSWLKPALFVFALAIGFALAAEQVGLDCRGGLGREVMAARQAGPGGSAREVYAQALAAYYVGEYDRAAALFDRLTGRVPADLEDDLLFWQGECAFRLGRVEAARAAFLESLTQMPNGPRAKTASSRLALLANGG